MPTRNLGIHPVTHPLSRVVLVSLLFVPFLYAQTNPFQGQPMVDRDSTRFLTDSQGTIVDAYVYSTSGDMCDRIRAAWINTPGATIDARGFTSANAQPAGAQPCAGSPFPANAKGRLLLGNVWVKTTMPWVIPAGVEVIGLGVSGLSGDGSSTSPVNTVLAPDTNFPQNTSIIKMGSLSGDRGVKVRSLTVDCEPDGSSSPISGCVGIENSSAGDDSTVEDVAIDNAPSYGLHVVVGDPNHTLYAAYSGPYRNITVQYPACSSACNNAIGVLVECQTNGTHLACANGESPVTVHFDNLTCSASGTTNSAMGFYINAVPVILTNSHFEDYNTNVQIGIGQLQSTHDVRIENVSLADGAIVNASQSSNVTLIGISGPGSDFLILRNKYPDTLNHDINAQFLGFYALGAGTVWQDCSAGHCPSLVTTYPKFEWRAPSNYTK